MQTLEYHYVDKSAWDRGPWDAEPDKRQWLDAETGLPCLIVRNRRGGNLCGYVGVSTGHPLFEKTYSDRIPVPDRNAVAITENIGAMAPFIEAMREDDGCVALDCLLDVHGGITFADHCCPSPEAKEQGICHVVEPGDDDNVWWLGFDCAHAWDLSPGYDLPGSPFRADQDATYRDWAYVESQVRSLATQLVGFVAPQPEA